MVLESCRNSGRGFAFTLFTAFIAYFGGLAILEIFSSGYTGFDLSLHIHSSSGIFTGYTQDNLFAFYAILLSIGILLGVGNNSLLNGIFAALIFVVLQIIIFFGVGLLYLGIHNDYNLIFQSIISTVIFPMGILMIGVLFGSLVVKRPPKYMIDIANF